MPKIRILLVGMPPMLAEIIQEAIAEERDMTVVGHVDPQTDLAALTGRRRIDVVLFNHAACRFSDEQIERVLRIRPRLGLLELDAPGDRGTLHHLVRVAEDTGPLEQSSLASAIRAGFWSRP